MQQLLCRVRKGGAERQLVPLLVDEAYGQYGAGVVSQHRRDVPVEGERRACRVGRQRRPRRVLQRRKLLPEKRDRAARLRV